MSASVVLQPMLMRSEWWASTPIASSTGEGTRSSEAQALPEWAAMPAWSSPSSTACGSMPSTPRHTRWGSRSVGSPKTVTPSGRPAAKAEHAVGQPAIRQRLAGRGCRPADAAAAPQPTMAGTFSKPARRARS